MDAVSERYLEISNLASNCMVGGASFKYDKQSHIKEINTFDDAKGLKNW
jgi:hypothetical protein